MAKGDVGKFAAGFGEGLLKTIQANREQKERETQFNQKMNFENRQLKLIDAYRMASLGLEERRTNVAETNPFETKSGDIFSRDRQGIDFSEPLWKMPEAPQKQEGTKDPRVGSDGFIHRWSESEGKYIKSNLKAPEKEVSDSKNDNDKTSEVDISTPAGEVQKWLTFYEGYKKSTDIIKYTDSEGNEVEVDKKLWRLMVSEPLEKMLTKAGVNSRSDIVANLWKGIEGSATNKRETLKKRIFELRRQDAINESQYQALLTMAEVKTR